MSQNSHKWDDLKLLTTNLIIVLQKAQRQFQERNPSIQSGYIQDLRQYFKIVTISEEQLLLGLVDFDLQFLGEFLKTISGYHLLLMNHLLNWIQQFEFYLAPKEQSTPFEQLLEQSLKHKHKFIQIKESKASISINDLHSSMQNIAETNKSMIDTYGDTKQPEQNNIEAVSDETDKMRMNLRSKDRKNTQLLLNKLINKQKQKTGNDQSSQTLITGHYINELKQDNMDVKLLLDSTVNSYEDKLKYQIALNQESKLLLKLQQCELEHKLVLLDAQTKLLRKIQSSPSQPYQVNALSNFHSVPTIAEKNRKINISAFEKSNTQILSNIKVRSSSLPKIDPNIEQVMRQSFSKVNVSIQRNVIQSHKITEIYQRYHNSQEFAIQFAEACRFANLTIPPSLNVLDSDEPSKLITVLQEKHTFCSPKCDHLSFLY